MSANVLSVPPVAVSFAAHDPTVGAGLSADVLTLSFLGCQAAGVLTGLTAQDTHGVHVFEALSPDWVLKQADVLLADFQPSVFKTGALCSDAVVRAVAGVFARYPTVPLVADPVLASGRGDALAGGQFRQAYIDALLPHVTVLTPNVPEALALSQADTLEQAIRFFFSRGVKAVLLTGTHDETTGSEVVNRLYVSTNECTYHTCLRLPGHFHGSGCTLASAVAAGLARGLTLQAATQEGLQYTHAALLQATRPGAGQSLPQRMPGSPGQWLPATSR